MRNEARSVWPLLLGVLTIWPAIYVFVFIAYLLSQITSGSSTRFPEIFSVLHIATIALVFFLLVFYIVHARRNQELDDKRRLIWTAVIVLTHFLGMPVYWFRNIWRPRTVRRRSQNGVALVLACSLPLLSSCSSDWGDKELLLEIHAADPARTSVELAGTMAQPAVPLSPTITAELLAQIAELPAAKTIGSVSPWTHLCRLEIRIGDSEPLLLKIATRESLNNRPIAILRDKNKVDTRMGFYGGDSILAWMNQKGLCAADAVTSEGSIEVGNR